MRAKDYFEHNNTTNSDHPNSTSESRPERFDRKNQPPDLILKPESKKAFHNWYVNQRNRQLEKQLSNIGNRDYSLNTIDFPPKI
ncbi:MAG: hypothetical protein AAF378_21060 [Cyanobacteria bacterium P01_A01_bin.84]